MAPEIPANPINSGHGGTNGPRPGRRMLVTVAWMLLLMLSSSVVGGLVVHRSQPKAGSRIIEGRAIMDELEPIMRRFGPDKNSSHEEEYFIRDYFGDRRNGVFLDVGSGHYRNRSNTYFLEHNLEWSGIAVDAQAKFAANYAVYRPKTRFFNLFVSDVTDQRIRFYVGKNDLFSSSDRSFTEGYAPAVETKNVVTITLNDLLQAANIEHIHFMSMDIELAEPKALAGFDIERFRPELVCIEAHPEIRQQLLDYFHKHHYVVVGKYLRADPQNLWFVPDNAAPAKSKPDIDQK